MSPAIDKRSRGRPKTLDRSRILELAMVTYWGEGVHNVSLNELCRRAGVSKPAVYREFGSEDGLKAAALEHYFDQVLAEFHTLFAGDLPFETVLDLVVEIITGPGANPNHPAGCLFVVMSNAQHGLGGSTQSCIAALESKILSIYSEWFARAQERSEFTRGIPADHAAFYLHSQVSNAMNHIALGDPTSSIKPALDLALSALRPAPPSLES